MDLVSSKHIEEFIPGEILYHGAIQVTPFRNKEYIKKFSKNYELGTDSKLAQFLGYVDPPEENTCVKADLPTHGSPTITTLHLNTVRLV